MSNSAGPQPNQLFDLSDADVARTLMGTVSEVCQALGVTVRCDVQIADSAAQNLDKVHQAIKDTIMVLSHIVVRSGLADRESIKAAYESSSQSEGKDQ
jgi:hypothetical protein